MPGADLLEPFGHDASREFRSVALTAEVSQIQMSEVRRDNLLGDIGGRFIGQMAVTAKDSLFKAPRSMGTVLQHLDVVICLKYQHIGLSCALDHQLCRMSQVS